MVCPLCKAEFRDDFTQCNDCKLGLLDRALAERTPVVRIWTGWNQRKGDGFASELTDKGIPCRVVVDVRWPPFTLWNLLRGYRQEFVVELFVLASDAARAGQVLRQ